MSVEKQILVTVRSQYLREHSEPEANRFAFGYTVTIRNEGSLAAKLVTRHWIITDANGHVQEVHGEGVIGEQPVISPGQHYEYSSGAVLPTPVGSMHGAYTMLTPQGKHFEAIIPAFRLAIPEVVN
jgi:ApaG protein